MVDSGTDSGTDMMNRRHCRELAVSGKTFR